MFNNHWNYIKVFKDSSSNDLKERVAWSPEGERNNWLMLIQVLAAEIEILKLSRQLKFTD
jgi:hypothetical protein